MGGIELDALELVWIRSAGMHERQGPVDVGSHCLVALPREGVADEVLVPGVHLPQIGVATLGECPHEVQCGR